VLELLEHVAAGAGGGEPEYLQDDVALLALRLHERPRLSQRRALRSARLRHALERHPARL
jgi:hypothetical protein